MFADTPRLKAAATALSTATACFRRISVAHSDSPGIGERNAKIKETSVLLEQIIQKKKATRTYVGPCTSALKTALFDYASNLGRANISGQSECSINQCKFCTNLRGF